MDGADEADRATQRLIEAAAKLMQGEARSAQPMLVTLCLQCGKPIERVSLKDIRDGVPIRRWCCIDCRDAWQEENEDDGRR